MASQGIGRRGFAGCAAAFVSIAVHLLLVGGVLLSEGGRRARVPADEGLGANAIESDAEATATLILIEDPNSGPRSDEVAQELTASLGKVLQNLRLTIVTPTPTFDLALDGDTDPSEKTDAATENSTADREARAALFGRYLGQIQARVERAWMRPRTAIGAESFECRVQLLQNARGEVQEVTLQKCNGDTLWQMSLVHALERASPLPAPPDPKVFAEALQLSFQSREYGAGSNEDEFEPAGFQTAQASAPVR